MTETTNTYTPADFEHARIAHKGNSLAQRRDISKLPWSVHVWNRDLGVYANSTWMDDASLASEDWTPGPPPRNGNEQENEQARIDHIQEQDRIIRRRNDEIKSLRKELDVERSASEGLRDDVWERGEIIGDLREDLAAAEARVPSTPEEALTLAWELACPVPDGQMIPAGTPLIERWSDGGAVAPAGRDVDLPATVSYVERRTLRPLPTPRPRHAEVIGGVLIAEIGMHDDDARDTADKIARAIEEQEGQDDE